MAFFGSFVFTALLVLDHSRDIDSDPETEQQCRKKQETSIHQHLSVWALCSALLQDSVLALLKEINFGIRVPERVLVLTAATGAAPSSGLDFPLAHNQQCPRLPWLLRGCDSASLCSPREFVLSFQGTLQSHGHPLLSRPFPAGTGPHTASSEKYEGLEKQAHAQNEKHCLLHTAHYQFVHS